MVRFSLDKNLDEIAGGANHSEVVYNLILWAETKGQLKELLTGARKENPGNQDLRRFDENEIKRMALPNMNQFLSNIIAKEEDLDSIFIFDFKGGLPLYFTSKNPKIHYILFGDNDIGQALKHFENLNQVQKALDSFGKATSSGELNYSILKLTKGQLMVYFYNLPDTLVGICFIAFSDITLGKLVSLGTTHIQKIKDNIPNQ